ncbi:MAG: class I tRNA ligase family protein [Elusimicrobia bacterium]|nr:class I tRNA ligase family protein [Elusimicrobiota bacterium]
MKPAAEALTFQQIDAKQQAAWRDQKAFRTQRSPGKPKFYCLDMFPYPSGDGLHVGHPEGYTASDILCRYKRMKGFEVLHPMGWDAFGLPAENYAISTGVHPRVITEKNCVTFKRQIDSLGFSYDWEREITTIDPAYYRWTQWIFLQLFRKGLAYEATVPINWCPKCKTGLANEEVFQGRCDRCETPIEKKNLKQWMLKITAYGDRLLADLEGTEWPHSTMLMQKNWIGRSEGAEVDFALPGGEKLTVFTTRPDTLYGATYMVLAPEHPLTAKLTTPEHKAAVEAYIAAAGNKSDLERTELAKDKTGVFTGWKGEGPFCDDGTAVNSGIIDGLPTPEAKKKITAWLGGKGIGRAKVNFKLRDWVFARQRYWGEPIPIVHCPKCGAVPVPENELPLLLPEVEKYQPSGTGESPLAAIDSWVNTKCPVCGTAAKRETNTMPQWAGSCWYYLRFIDPKNSTVFVDKELEKAWMPVDLYIGGAEHAVLHLLYARFWHKVLFDLGLVSTKEPFKKLVHQGMILSYSYRDGKGVYRGYGELDIAEDGTARTAEGETLKPMVEKMSKSKKNVINPDEIYERYGADAFRLYEMFLGPLEDAKPWNVRGIEGVYRFLKRAYAWGLERHQALTEGKASGPDLLLRHQTIEKVSADIEALKFNTAISALMVYLNRLTEQETTSREDFNTFLALLHPFAPHITDELWELAGGAATLMKQPWPAADKSVIASRDIEIPVQLNGKVKERLSVKETTPQEEIRRLALEKAAPHLAGRTVVKVIVVPGRLVSIVVK